MTATLTRRQLNERREKLARAKRAKIAGRKPARDQKYLAWLRECWCAIGEKNGSENCSRVIEAAHVGPRGLRLCIHHHRTGAESHHQMQRRFWGFHCIDRDALIAEYNQRYENEAELQKRYREAQA